MNDFLSVVECAVIYKDILQIDEQKIHASFLLWKEKQLQFTWKPL